MPGRRRKAVDLPTLKILARKHPRESTVVLLNRKPSSLALKAHALRVSRKLDGQSRERPQLSSGIDPGPSGFDWTEL
jgi:hypothetical protein